MLSVNNERESSEMRTIIPAPARVIHITPMTQPSVQQIILRSVSGIAKDLVAFAAMLAFVASVIAICLMLK